MSGLGRMSRRKALAIMAGAGAAALMGCAPKIEVQEKIVKETVEVQKIITALAPTSKPTKPTVIDAVFEDITCADKAVLGGACAKDWAAKYMASHPNTIVNITMLGDGTGSTAGLDAMLIAGYPVNVYQAYGGRISNYRDMAALFPYTPAKYVHPAVDSWVKDGKLTWLPTFAWAVGTIVNYDLAVRLGVDSLLPKLDGDRTWTLAQWEALAEAVKAKSTAQKPIYTSALFAASGAGDYWLAMWMFAFGGKLYKLNADGSTNFKALDMQAQPWVDALNWLKRGVEKGYFMPNPETIAFGAVGAEFQAGKLLFGYASAASYMTDAISRQAWMSYPSPTGKFVPFATGPTGIMVFDTAARLQQLKSAGKAISDAAIAEAKTKDAAALDFATWLDANYTQVQVDAGRHSWRTDITPSWATDSATPAAGPTLSPTAVVEQGRFKSEQRWQKRMIDKYGLTDIGCASPFYSPLREIMWKAFGEFFAGKVDAAKCLANIDGQFNALVTPK